MLVIFLCLGTKGYTSFFYHNLKLSKLFVCPKRDGIINFLKTSFGWPILIVHYSFISTHFLNNFSPTWLICMPSIYHPNFIVNIIQHLKTQVSKKTYNFEGYLKLENFSNNNFPFFIQNKFLIETFCSKSLITFPSLIFKILMLCMTFRHLCGVWSIFWIEVVVVNCKGY
jgi:hypothetical protein